jgi:competence protein ComEA
VEYEEEPLCELFTDISGAVSVPGVYCLSSMSILDDLISQAGGFTEDVCQEWVSRELNRAQMLENGMKLYIPSENEEECTNELGTQTVSPNTEKVSINKASQSEIETLSGIGPSIAKEIIDGRPYSKLEDLLDVKGIGNAIFGKIQDDIVL